MNRDLPSTDMVRLIRRSMRCLAFGVVGVVPLFGAGFAWQALRLQRAITRELADGWEIPPMYCYWLMGSVLFIAVDRWGGGLGDLAVCLVLLAVQSCHLWRSFLARNDSVWNPGAHQVLLGMLSANAGLSLSLWTLVLLVLRLTRVAEAV